MTADITLHQNGPIAEIIWAAPRLNLFTAQTADELEACLDQLSPGTRALLLRGSGRTFCAGVDVHEFSGMSAAAGTGFSNRLLKLISRIESLPFPTVASVHGLNLTIGLELVLAFDFVLAAPEASMGLVEPKVGLAPAAGGIQRLVARIGLTRATRMVLTGAVIDATTLAQWGLIDRIVDAADLLGTARDFTAELAAGPTMALHAAKQVLQVAAYESVATADERTPAIAGPIMASRDARAGIAGMLEHGPGHRAQFSGC